MVIAFPLKRSRGSPPEQPFAGGEVPAPTVATMDVEGAAPDGLDGMVGTIRHPACRLVVVELHDDSDEIVRRLLAAGFDVDEVRLARERRG